MKPHCPNDSTDLATERNEPSGAFVPVEQKLSSNDAGTVK